MFNHLDLRLISTKKKKKLIALNVLGLDIHICCIVININSFSFVIFCGDEKQGCVKHKLYTLRIYSTGSLDVYHILYAWPIHTSMDPPFLIGRACSSSSLCRIPIRNSSRHLILHEIILNILLII